MRLCDRMDLCLINELIADQPCLLSMGQSEFISFSMMTDISSSIYFSRSFICLVFIRSDYSFGRTI